MIQSNIYIESEIKNSRGDYLLNLIEYQSATTQLPTNTDSCVHVHCTALYCCTVDCTDDWIAAVSIPEILHAAPHKK